MLFYVVRTGYTRFGLITKRPRSSSFWVPRNLSLHMNRQARTGDTMLVNSREMTGRILTVPWLVGEGGKDDRKQNMLAPLGYTQPTPSQLTWLWWLPPIAHSQYFFSLLVLGSVWVGPGVGREGGLSFFNDSKKLGFLFLIVFHAARQTKLRILTTPR